MSERRSAAHWFWPTATAAMTAATVLLATMLIMRSGQVASRPPGSEMAPVVEVVDQRPSAAPGGDVMAVNVDGSDVMKSAPIWPWATPPTTGYLAIRYVALTQGVAALDHDALTGTTGNNRTSGDESRPPVNSRQLLEELLLEIAPRGGANGSP
jgi:hypothetical protein